jgi:hypothetical protein
MRPAAAERDRRDAGREGEHVDVREIGGDHQRRAGEARAMFESGLT